MATRRDGRIYKEVGSVRGGQEKSEHPGTEEHSPPVGRGKKLLRHSKHPPGEPVSLVSLDDSLQQMLPIVPQAGQVPSSYHLSCDSPTGMCCDAGPGTETLVCWTGKDVSLTLKLFPEGREDPASLPIQLVTSHWDAGSTHRP